MASDNRAHYTRIGFTVVIGVVAIAATLVYMGGFHDPRSEFMAETYSNMPVSGLSVGSPVNLFGVKVGEVREISFAPATYDNVGSNDFGRVCIVLAIKKKLIRCSDITDENIRQFIRERTRAGLRATVASNGITGLSRVDLKIIDNPSPADVPVWTSRYPLILPAPSLMDNFSVAATKVMNKLKTIDLDAAWSNITRIVESSARVAENMDELVESQRAGVHEIVGDVRDMSAALKELAVSLKENPSLLLRENDPRPLPETER